MAGNHLESLVAEWYEFNGYFVRRNVQVGKRPEGGYEAELDVVAFDPGQRLLVQVEPSLDTKRWDIREARYTKKFDAGRKYIPRLFPNLVLPNKIDQIALFVHVGRARETIAGGRVVPIAAFMEQIRAGIGDRKVGSAAIPEGFPLLRTLQFAAQFWQNPKEAPAPPNATSCSGTWGKIRDWLTSRWS